MTSPLPLPEWIPWWAQLAILAALLLFGLMFLLMPFAVFGVKGRLDLLEARLDEIQGEIRSLSLRLPEPGHDDGAGMGQAGAAAWRDGGPSGTTAPAGQRPPIPPAPRDRSLGDRSLDDRPLGDRSPGKRASPPGPSRTEPRLY